MDRWARGLLRVLVVFLVLNIATSLLARTVLVVTPHSGHGRWVDLLGAVGLGVLLAMLAVLAVSWHTLRDLWRQAREATDRLDAVAATSHDWLWQATPDLVATYCSPATAEVLGYRPQEVLGRSFLDLLHPEDAVTARAILDTALATSTGWSDVELRWVHRDGALVTLQGSGVPILDTDGRVVGFRGTRRIAPPDGAAVRLREQARRRVEQTLAAHALDVAFQPIIDLTRGQWVGVEALTRFRDGRTPDIWFAEAHAVGLGVDLELLAIQTALAAVRDLPATVSVSVNASARVILDPAFARALTYPGIDLDRLVVEITEHELVTDYDLVNGALTPLRERGLQVAVDDTGAGYASFTHVLRLRPDIIKLDRSLLTGLPADPARRALVTAIVLLGLELDARLVAEGVETPEELRAVTDLGVDLAQGYHLARPALEHSVWRFWATKNWPQALDSAAAVTARD
jgi:PAS domain S-box-containing protein